MVIITVCGMGFGTSLLLKMTIDDILADNGLKAQVSAWDLSSIKGQKADLYVASEDMRANMKDIEGKIIFIKNLMDFNEISEKLLEVIK